MIQANLQELQNVITGSSLTQDVSFVGLSTDSRKINRGNLFVALSGENFDAHDFLHAVAAAGAAAVVVEHIPEGLTIPALVVPGTKLALIQIGQFWRKQFQLPVIGVTGSNGKTTVKEMIASILREQYGNDDVISTQGNLNNEIGVPLTVLRLNQQHRAAVIELGMNHVGEIAVLSSIACPNVGLVNNAQREHQEFMQTVEAVAIENGAVLRHLPKEGIAVFPADDTYSDLWRTFANESGGRKIVSFGLTSAADVYAEFSPAAFGSTLQLHIEGQSIEIALAAAGQHNVMNALAAAACCHAIGVPLTVIAKGLEAFVPVAGRLQLKRAIGGAKLIDDTYNANPDSVKAAIDVLTQTKGSATKRVILVLGDMGEVGEDGEKFHEEIGLYAKTCGVDQLFTLGDLAQASSRAFGTSACHCEDLDTLLRDLRAHMSTEDTILIKGSRFMKMERVVVALLEQN
jgi:UDP-N-acetylmuramoyl-tripeptide--D-alanyl-D-alanine ligase